jgi:hypothetical protein
LQRAHDHLSLDFFEWRADGQRERVFVTQTLTLFDRVRREMMALDLLSGADDYGSLDHVAKLAHVAGPGVKL